MKELVVLPDEILVQHDTHIAHFLVASDEEKRQVYELLKKLI